MYIEFQFQADTNCDNDRVWNYLRRQDSWKMYIKRKLKHN